MRRLLLTLRGRIPRSTFAGGLCGAAALTALLLALPVPSTAAGLALQLPVCWLLFVLFVKRLHDRGKSAWWLLLLALPLLGPMWLLIELLFLPGTPGENRFGGDPLLARGDYLVVR